jgi:hypothetical protein
MKDLAKETVSNGFLEKPLKRLASLSIPSRTPRRSEALMRFARAQQYNGLNRYCIMCLLRHLAKARC